MKKTLRTALFLAVITATVVPAFADDPGGTVPPPSEICVIISSVLSLLGL